MSWEPEVLLTVPAITIRESAFSNVPAHPTQHKSRGDSCNRNEERFSKMSNGGGIPESRERDPESPQNSCSVQELIKAFESLDPKPQKQPASIQDGKERLPFVPPAFNNAPGQPTQHKSRLNSFIKNEEKFFQLRNGEGIQESRETDPESQHQFSIVQERRKIFESPALTHGPMKAPKTESGVDSHKSVQERFSKQSKGNADPVIPERAFNNAPEQPTQHKSRGDSCNRNEERFSKTSNGEGIQESRERDPESQHQFSTVQEQVKNFESPALSHGPMKAPKTESGVDSHKSVQERFSQQSKGNADPVIPERAFNNAPEQPTQHKSRRDSCNRNEERFSKTSNGEGIQESRERDPESQHQFSTVQEQVKNFESPALTHGPKKAPKTESAVDSCKRVQERLSRQSKGNADPVILERGRTVETNTSWGQESMREEMEKILSEKLAVLQRQLEMTQQAIPPMKEMTNTWASLQKLPENMQAPQKGLENLQESTKEDLQTLRADLEERVPKTWNVPKRSESKENLVENQAGFFKMQRYKVDVTLNADTAHPRLEVSEDGKSVTDTGVIRQVPSKEERFDSHTFVLAKEGYTSGRQYWEVDVGRRRNWILGVASESVARKGTMTLSPKNGFWVIGLADGEEYWAHTDPWTRLTVSGKPEKIGIFLNISANKLSFYNVKKKTVLYTFTSIGGSRLERKFVPFFSTGSSGSVHDTEPLKIVQEFDDDD